MSLLATDRCPRLLVCAVLLMGVALAPSARAAERYVPREVIVRYDAGTRQSVRQRLESVAGAHAAHGLPDGSRRLDLRTGETVGHATATLRRDRHVTYAVANYVCGRAPSTQTIQV